MVTHAQMLRHRTGCGRHVNLKGVRMEPAQLLLKWRQMSDRSRAIVELIARCRLVATWQVADLMYDSEASVTRDRRARAELSRLEREGWIVGDHVPGWGNMWTRGRAMHVKWGEWFSGQTMNREHYAQSGQEIRSYNIAHDGQMPALLARLRIQMLAWTGEAHMDDGVHSGSAKLRRAMHDKLRQEMIDHGLLDDDGWTVLEGMASPAQASAAPTDDGRRRRRASGAGDAYSFADGLLGDDAYSLADGPLGDEGIAGPGDGAGGRQAGGHHVSAMGAGAPVGAGIAHGGEVGNQGQVQGGPEDASGHTGRASEHPATSLAGHEVEAMGQAARDAGTIWSGGDDAVQMSARQGHDGSAGRGGLPTAGGGLGEGAIHTEASAFEGVGAASDRGTPEAPELDPDDPLTPDAPYAGRRRARVQTRSQGGASRAGEGAQTPMQEGALRGQKPAAGAGESAVSGGDFGTEEGAARAENDPKNSPASAASRGKNVAEMNSGDASDAADKVRVKRSVRGRWITPAAFESPAVSPAAMRWAEYWKWGLSLSNFHALRGLAMSYMDPQRMHMRLLIPDAIICLQLHSMRPRELGRVKTSADQMQALTARITDSTGRVDEHLRQAPPAPLLVPEAGALVPMIFEYDNGTKKPGSVAAQLIAYEYLAQQGQFAERWPDFPDGYQPPVFMVFSTEQRMHQTLRRSRSIIQTRERQRTRLLRPTDQRCPIFVTYAEAYSNRLFTQPIFTSLWDDQAAPQLFIDVLLRSQRDYLRNPLPAAHVLRANRRGASLAAQGAQLVRPST
jgi:hypothetical protein